jgi:hypothetical protein
MRETGQVEALLAPWSSGARRRRRPRASISPGALPPRWGNVAPLLNDAFYATALRDSRAPSRPRCGRCARRAARVRLGGAQRNTQAPTSATCISYAVRAAAIRRHAREVLERCGARLSAAGARALQHGRDVSSLRCPLCNARAAAARAKHTGRDSCVASRQHRWQLDVRTMALLGSVCASSTARLSGVPARPQSRCASCRAMPTTICDRAAATCLSALAARAPRRSASAAGCRCCRTLAARAHDRRIYATFDVND